MTDEMILALIDELDGKDFQEMKKVGPDGFEYYSTEPVFFEGKPHQYNSPVVVTTTGELYWCG